MEAAVREGTYVQLFGGGKEKGERRHSSGDEVREKKVLAPGSACRIGSTRFSVLKSGGKRYKESSVVSVFLYGGERGGGNCLAVLPGPKSALMIHHPGPAGGTGRKGKR